MQKVLIRALSAVVIMFFLLPSFAEGQYKYRYGEPGDAEIYSRESPFVFEGARLLQKITEIMDSRKNILFFDFAETAALQFRHSY